MSDQPPRRRLGRGLEALLGPDDPMAVRDEAAGEIAVNAIAPNPFQPRRTFGADELSELTESLRTTGLLQPILVRPAAGGYELIAGERRLRAAQQLGWSTIPAIVREADDTTLLTLALVENLQRDSLSPVEEAQGYQRLLGEFGLSHQQVADAVGRDRSTIANAVRLLKLPSVVLTLIHERRLSVGHARTLVTLDDEQRAIELASEAVAKDWSVREMEARVKPGRPRVRRVRIKKPQSGDHPEQRRVEDALRRRLQTDMRLVLHGTKGRIEIAFYSNDDLARLLEIVLGTPFA